MRDIHAQLDTVANNVTESVATSLGIKRETVRELLGDLFNPDVLEACTATQGPWKVRLLDGARRAITVDHIRDSSDCTMMIVNDENVVVLRESDFMGWYRQEILTRLAEVKVMCAGLNLVNLMRWSRSTHS